MLRTLPTAALCLLLSAPAFAGERARLVTGSVAPVSDGGRFSGSDATAELYSTGGLRLGALVDSTPGSQGNTDRLAFGGYAGYAGETYSLSSSLRGDDTGSAADLTASYLTGLGTAAMSVGYEWSGRPAAFSINPWQPAAIDGLRPLSDLSLSVSFTHDLNSAFSLGGFAAASRSEFEDRATEHGFRLGATMGLKF